MSQEAKQEKTVGQPESSQELEATASNQAPERIGPLDEGQPEEIPQKFIGKSAQDIIKSYRELESQFGKISSEKAQIEKEREEIRQRQLALESELQRTTHQQPVPQQVQVDEDPLSNFDKVFESDPKEAVKETFKKVQEKIQRAGQEAYYAAQRQAQAEYYNRMKKENPDFAELEPEMIAIAQKFGPHLHPSVLNSPEAIDLMYSIARGRNVQKYVQREVEKTKTASQLVREEKRNTFSETTNSAGDTARPFESLSLSEMKAMLGVAK